MKKILVGIVLGLLMIAGIVMPLSGTISAKESSPPLLKDNIRYGETEKLFNDLRLRLDAVTTKQEALGFFKEAIVELNDHGLLPKGMSVKHAQRLVTGYFLRSGLARSFQSNTEDNSGNTNCLVLGITDNTYFRPYPALVMDNPFIHNLAFNSSHRNITCFLALPYVFRLLQPFKFGPYVEIGNRVRFVEHENITDDISPSSGLILTYGSNGFKKWNGAFFGSLNPNYQKFVYNNYTSLELWDPVGMIGFTGINFLSVATLNQNIPTIYIGFAREVNFTYNYPWT